MYLLSCTLIFCFLFWYHGYLISGAISTAGDQVSSAAPAPAKEATALTLTLGHFSGLGLGNIKTLLQIQLCFPFVKLSYALILESLKFNSDFSLHETFYNPWPYQSLM